MDGSAYMVLLAALFLGTYGLTGTVRRYASRQGILDVPNARSSHSVPTPRGGGLAMVVVFLVSMCALAIRGVINANVAIAVGGGGLIVAGIGWADDKYDLSPGLRLAIQVAAAIWALYWLGGLPELNVGVARIHLGPVGFVLAIVGIVWSINLYNFMDGIDGFAGSECLTTGASAFLLMCAMEDGWLPSAAATGASIDTMSVALVTLLLVPIAAGFLVWNWAPAKVFMGDVGSGFLGFAFAVLAVASENSGGLPLLTWVLLLGVFVVDATATLVRRKRRGERCTEAHRTHAYQLAVQAGYAHEQVVIRVIVINIVLGVAAAGACFWPRALLAIVAGCVLILFALWRRVVGHHERHAQLHDASSR